MSQGRGLCLGDVLVVLDVLDVVLLGFRRSWGHARGCGQALMHAGRMWGSRGRAPGQGCPHILARVPWSLMVLGQHLTCVQCMSNASGMRLDMQHIGGSCQGSSPSLYGRTTHIVRSVQPDPPDPPDLTSLCLILFLDSRMFSFHNRTFLHVLSSSTFYLHLDPWSSILISVTYPCLSISGSH